MEEEQQQGFTLAFVALITECNFRDGVDFHCDATGSIRSFILSISLSLSLISIFYIMCAHARVRTHCCQY